MCVTRFEEHPMATLNNKEYVDLVNRDQELYEKVLEIDPDYPDTVMPPPRGRRSLSSIEVLGVDGRSACAGAGRPRPRGRRRIYLHKNIP